MNDLLTELRSYKIYDMAVFDLSISMFVFYYIAKYFKSDRPMLWAFGSIPLSIFIHKAFDVQTGLTKKYDNFMNTKPTDQQQIITKPIQPISANIDWRHSTVLF